MSGLRSGLVTGVVAAAVGVFTVIGCSVGSSGAIDDTAPPEQDSGAILPPSSSSGNLPDDAGNPDAKQDASPKDAAPDTGPPPPVPGAPCVTVDEVRKKSCGACGNQSTICLDVGGAKTWSGYSPCEQELAGGCMPGTVVDEPCGNCGTLKKTCTQLCVFSALSCAGQPANACAPGSVELQSAGCPSNDLFHQRTCGATCVAPTFSVACSPPPTLIEVAPAAGNVSSTVAILSETQTLPRISGTFCPTATFLATTLTPYVYLQVHNPLAKSATVAIYNSLAAGGVAFKTALAAYDGAAPSDDDASRKVCLKAATFGTTALTGDSKFASLDGSKVITLAPGATVSVYLAAYNAFDAAKPADSTGRVKLNVATISVQ